MKKLVLILCLLHLSSNSFALASSSVLTRVEENQAPAQARGEGLVSGCKFVDASEVNASDPVYWLLGLTSAQEVDKQLFIGRASYHLAVPSIVLNRGLFENIELVKYLLGTTYSGIKQIAADPFSFHGVRRVSVALFSANIASDTEMTVYEASELKDEKLRSLVLSLKGAPSASVLSAPAAGRLVRIVLQKMNHFSDFLDGSFLLTLIYDNAAGGTTVEVYGASALKDNSIPGFGLIRESVVSSITNSDLVGYVQRLAAYTRQFTKPLLDQLRARFFGAVNQPIE